MTLWLQHLLVLLIVAACFAVVALQGVRTLRGKKSKLGACCAKGCDEAAAKPPVGSAQGRQAAGKRVVFFPSEMLTSSARRRRDQ